MTIAIMASSMTPPAAIPTTAPVGMPSAPLLPPEEPSAPMAMVGVAVTVTASREDAVVASGMATASEELTLFDVMPLGTEIVAVRMTDPADTATSTAPGGTPAALAIPCLTVASRVVS